MIATIASSFAVPEIRKKILFTAAILALYRLGSYIPVPAVNLDAIDAASGNFDSGNILSFLNLFSGGGLSRLALFSPLMMMGATP